MADGKRGRPTYATTAKGFASFADCFQLHGPGCWVTIKSQSKLCYSRKTFTRPSRRRLARPLHLRSPLPLPPPAPPSPLRHSHAVTTLSCLSPMDAGRDRQTPETSPVTPAVPPSTTARSEQSSWKKGASLLHTPCFRSAMLSGLFVGAMFGGFSYMKYPNHLRAGSHAVWAWAAASSFSWVACRYQHEKRLERVRKTFEEFNSKAAADPRKKIVVMQNLPGDDLQESIQDARKTAAAMTDAAVASSSPAEGVALSKSSAAS